MIREIRKEDNLAVKEIIQHSLKSLGLDKPGTAYFDPQLGDLFGYYNDLHHAHYWVIEKDGEIVGGIGIAPFNDSQEVCELQKLYIVPQAQGLGLANKLMETALSFATEHYQSCYLETVHQLKTANKLYGKFGFILLEEPLIGSEHSAMDAWYLKTLN